MSEYKPKSDSYLMSMTKDEIIKELRIVENNYRAIKEMYNNATNASIEIYEENKKLKESLKSQSHIKWISINDRLPDRCGWYLVFDESDMIVLMLQFDDGYEKPEDAFGLYHNKYDSTTLGFIDSEFEPFGLKQGYNITHWTYIDEPNFNDYDK